MFIFLIICGYFSYCVTGYNVTDSEIFYTLDDASEYFEEFIQEYGKHYKHEHEKKYRFRIFKDNLIDANRLNEEAQGDNAHSAIYGITEFMDLTSEEFTSKFAAFKPDNVSSLRSGCQILSDINVPAVNAPESFDWREKNVVSKVKHQGNCESCYAFSSTGHLEAQSVIKHQRSVELSEQQIVDCDKRSHGCNRGFMSNAFMSMMEMDGIMRESDYPYTGTTDRRCKFDRNRVVLKVKGCYTYRLRSQEKLKQLLYSVGPISIAVKATNMRKYKRGVISDRECNQGHINHAVLLVGYGTDSREGPYWIVKNSYGTQFGESGYFRMQRGERAQSCGVMNQFMASAIVEP